MSSDIPNRLPRAAEILAGFPEAFANQDTNPLVFARIKDLCKRANVDSGSLALKVYPDETHLDSLQKYETNEGDLALIALITARDINGDAAFGPGAKSDKATRAAKRKYFAIGKVLKEFYKSIGSEIAVVTDDDLVTNN